MQDLITIVQEYFNTNPIDEKPKNHFISPAILNINGAEITLLSTGKYLFNNKIHDGCTIKKALRLMYGKEKTAQILKELPSKKCFIIDAGYKWLDRQDLQDGDYMKSLGTTIQRLITQYILQFDGWSRLNNTFTMKDTDILVINNKLKIILYFECKLCMKLDTTKKPGEKEKISSILSTLSSIYPDMEIISGFLCPSLLDDSKSGSTMIYGLNFLIKTLGDNPLNDCEFVQLGKSIGRSIKIKSL